MLAKRMEKERIRQLKLQRQVDNEKVKNNTRAGGTYRIFRSFTQLAAQLNNLLFHG